MCGIFGTILSQNAFENIHLQGSNRYDRVLQLAKSNLARGNKQFGYWCWKPGFGYRMRYEEPFDAAKLPVVPMQVCLVHTRAPTGVGTNIPYVDIHPFETRDFVLMMNGLLLAYAQPHIVGRKRNTSVIDTAYLVGNIDWWQGSSKPPELSLAGALAKAVAEFTGQQACMMWYRPTNQVYVWRVMSPLRYRCEEGVRLDFSSAKQPEEGWQMFDEGKIYRIDPITLEIIPEESFPFTTPYSD